MFLLKMLGIRQVFVVVNKMDAVGYKSEQFETVKSQIGMLLNSFGFKTEVFIPISAMDGDNVYRKCEVMDWYKGPTLIETLDGVKLSSDEKPLRFVVQDIYSVDSERIIAGRVESGRLQKGAEVIFEPSGTKGEIERIIVFDADLEEAEAGDSIGVVITAGDVKRGDVFGLLKTPPKPVNEFLGEAVLLDKCMKKGENIRAEVRNCKGGV